MHLAKATAPKYQQCGKQSITVLRDMRLRRLCDACCVQINDGTWWPILRDKLAKYPLSYKIYRRDATKTVAIKWFSAEINNTGTAQYNF